MIESKKLRLRRLLRRFLWIWVAILFVLVLLFAIPFLATTTIAGFALSMIYPANNPSVGSVTLNPEGSVVIRELTLHDIGAFADKPLVTAGEVDATFGWKDLIAGRMIRSIRVADARIYARSNASSQLSLLDLFFTRTNKPNRATLPVWADVIEVDGSVHREAFAGFAAGAADWPLKIRMTMAGERMNPSRRVSVSFGHEKPAADFGLIAEVETEPAPFGTRILIRSLSARRGSLAVEADAIRHFVAQLPAELSGRIDANVANLSASGELDMLAAAPGHERASGSITFAGVRVRAPGKSRMVLGVDDLSGAVKFDTPIPPGAATSLKIERLNLTNLTSSIDADQVRKYIGQLPADLHGPIDSSIGSMSISGRNGSREGTIEGFRGDINLRDLSVRSPPGSAHAINVDRLTMAAHVDSPSDRPASVQVSGGVTRWASLSYGDNAVTNFDASWRIDNQVLSADHLVATLFDGTISGAPTFDLVTHAIDRCDLQIKSVDVHKALANASPEHLDAVGKASGAVHLALSTDRVLTGNVDLTFDGPGTLRIGQIEEVKQMLVGNFGLDMANLAMHDLEHYPFREGEMHLASSGQNSELKIKFIRQPKSTADVISPHKEMINGHEVMVGSLVVPTIDMTIPITGQSLAQVLSIVSGVHPMLQQAAAEGIHESGK
jgi:hypothetical protein